MTEVTATPAAAAAPDFIAKFTLPNLDGERSVDCSAIPTETRVELLKSAARGYVANRVNSVFQRHQKDAAVVAWNAYDEACKADPLQSVVAKPEGERPAPADLETAYTRAVEDLMAGNVRRQTGEGKTRTRKDPLIATVTDIVVREVFDSKHAADPKYTFIMARKEVGPDGVEYLNKLIEAKVAAGVDRAALEKYRDTKYIQPAKLMLGLTDNKATKELPSIL